MEKKQIIDNILKSAAIESLNPMQLAVLSSSSPQLILLSPTGSGKTLAFTIAMLKRMERPSGELQAVVVAPSRELTIQTGEVIRKAAVGYKTATFYGGHPMQAEVDSINGAMPDIVVSTPGRLLDHLTRGTLNGQSVRLLVLDEYDKSLELGFLDEMKRIARKLPRKLALTVLTSATRLTEIPQFLNLDNPETIDYTDRTEAPRARMQIVNVESPQRDKLATLTDLLLTLPHDEKTIVFLNHRESVERVYQSLKKAHFAVGMYHGGMEQRQREQALDLLDNGTTPVLISTDLASRGLDLDRVGSVIHYHIAPSHEAWTHRNGRTARVDASGTVYVITSEADNIPDYIVFDRSLSPRPQCDTPSASSTSTIYINAGKRDKISRGDVAGYMMQRGNLNRDEVGKISLKDHCALVAVPATKARQTIEAASPYKLKNKTVRLSILK